MIGWIVALALAGMVMLILHKSGKLSREALEIVFVAVLIALAGYAWQGSPDMPGKPVPISRAGG